MHCPFTFTPPASETAAKFLKARADHLITLNPGAQRIFLKSSLVLARSLPTGKGVSAMDKSLVLITLQRWLDEAREVA